jgi:hypothetical protein
LLLLLLLVLLLLLLLLLLYSTLCTDQWRTEGVWGFNESVEQTRLLRNAAKARHFNARHNKVGRNRQTSLTFDECD